MNDMKFDEETLIEIEDYINALEENVGLKPETMHDISSAIAKQRKLVKNINYDAVLATDACLHPMQSRVRTHRGYHCGDCGKRF